MKFGRHDIRVKLDDARVLVNDDLVRLDRTPELTKPSGRRPGERLKPEELEAGRYESFNRRKEGFRTDQKIDVAAGAQLGVGVDAREDEAFQKPPAGTPEKWE